MSLRRKISFKKSFLDADFICRHGAGWAVTWAPFELGPELCARMVLDVHQALYPKKWSNGREAPSGRFASSSALGILEVHRVRSLPETARQALLRWARGEIQLAVFDHLPIPQKVLELQAQGVRCVSVLRREEEIASFRMDGRDFYSFLIHDLIHAQLMTEDVLAYDQQCRFSAWLLERWPRLTPNLQGPAQAELEYLGSDMNSHVVHLIKTFRSWLERHDVKSLHPDELHPLWTVLEARTEEGVNQALTHLDPLSKKSRDEKRDSFIGSLS